MKLKYNLKNILLNESQDKKDPVEHPRAFYKATGLKHPFYGENPELPSDVADYSGDVEEGFGEEPYDPELSGYEEMDKIAQDKADKEAKEKDFWKYLFSKIAKSLTPEFSPTDDPPEGDVSSGLTRFMNLPEIEE